MDAAIRQRLLERFELAFCDADVLEAERAEVRETLQRAEILNGVAVQIERAQAGERAEGAHVADEVFREVQHGELREPRERGDVRQTVCREAEALQLRQRAEGGEVARTESLAVQRGARRVRGEALAPDGDRVARFGQVLARLELFEHAVDGVPADAGGAEIEHLDRHLRVALRIVDVRHQQIRFLRHLLVHGLVQLAQSRVVIAVQERLLRRVVVLVVALAPAAERQQQHDRQNDEHRSRNAADQVKLFFLSAVHK